jgi:anti-sigma B factor antagonist
MTEDPDCREKPLFVLRVCKVFKGKRMVVFRRVIHYFIVDFPYSFPVGITVAIKTSTLEGGIGLIEAKGSLTGGEETDELRRAIAGFLDRNYDKLIVDLGGVTYLNSTAIGVLVGAHTSYLRKNGRLKISGVSKNIDSIFVITKLTLVFDVYDTKEGAAKSFL